MTDDQNREDDVISFLPDEESTFVDEEIDSSAPEKKIKALKEKLSVCLTEKEGFLLGWQRERADFANFKKESTERETRRTEIAYEKIIEDIIPVLDSFSMAFANKEAWESVDKNWRAGVEYIHQQLSSALSSYGLEPFTDIGVPFDPLRHTAVDTKEVFNKEDDHTVVSVIQSGFMLKGKVFRPARVIIGEYKEESADN
jgi:molecular chaperone GrpE